MDFPSEQTGLIPSGTLKSNREVKSHPRAATLLALSARRWLHPWPWKARSNACRVMPSPRSLQEGCGGRQQG